jgi:hypothetical protein
VAPELADVDHRPLRASAVVTCPRAVLDLPYLRDDRLQRGGHQSMHRFRLVAFDEMRPVAVPFEQTRELFLADPREHGRIGDLVAVEMQDGQHGAVACWIEELVRMPRRSKWSGFCLTVTHDAAGDQLRVVEHCTERLEQAIPELAAFVDRAGRFRRGVARYAARK